MSKYMVSLFLVINLSFIKLKEKKKVKPVKLLGGGGALGCYKPEKVCEGNEDKLKIHQFLNELEE